MINNNNYLVKFITVIPLLIIINVMSITDYCQFDKIYGLVNSIKQC